MSLALAAGRGGQARVSVPFQMPRVHLLHAEGEEVTSGHTGHALPVAWFRLGLNARTTDAA